MKKNYKLQAKDIKRMVPSMGGVFASDMITLEGKNVDYMVRQEPEHESDSGWIMYGGGETQEYIDDPTNISIWDINTMANYDPEIIPFLTYPTGTEVERNDEGILEVIDLEAERPPVILLQPVEDGNVKITENWSFSVESRFLRRLENSSLVVWKPGFTIWMNVYNANDLLLEQRIESVVNSRPEKAFDFKKSKSNDLVKMSYRMIEQGEKGEQPSAYIFGFTEKFEVHMTIYFDDDKFLPDIESVFESLIFE
jgi:hypothetical protein